MGADSFAGFSRWHRAAEIPFVAPLIIASRPGELLNNLDSTLPEGLTLESAPLPESVASEVELHRCILRNSAGRQAPFFLLPGLHIDISASQVRDQLRSQPSHSPEAQFPESSLLPAPVLEYIRAHGLFR